MSSLGQKRLEALWAIAGYAAGSGAAAASTTPCAELPKQLLLTASDGLMYLSIWKTYFEQDLSNQDLTAMLTELGLVTVTAVGVAYTVARGSVALLCEITNWAGPLGWGASAAISGSIAGLSGMAWALYCDRRYSEQHLEATTAQDA